MEEKAILATWLFRTDISNLNAGEGTTNLKEIKTYGDGLPYISGQSVRHALRKAIKRENVDNFKCTVEYPCGDIKSCWLCDMFGYLLPGEGGKRWSPIKASPAMGQIKKRVTTDMILRLVRDIECPKCKEKINPMWARDKEGGEEKTIKEGGKLICPKCGGDFKAPYQIRQALAYKQLIDNIYRVSVSIDIAALGVHEIPLIEGEGKEAKIKGVKYKPFYDGDEKIKRIKAILKGISNMSDFASQSREMTNASPDVILISKQGEYNHRLTSALYMDKSGNIDSEYFSKVLKDVLSIPNTQIYAGFMPNVIENQQNVIEKIEEIAQDHKGAIVYKVNEKILTPREAINRVINSL